jgi:hypothetical protein
LRTSQTTAAGRVSPSRAGEIVQRAREIDRVGVDLAEPVLGPRPIAGQLDQRAVIWRDPRHHGFGEVHAQESS